MGFSLIAAAAILGFTLFMVAEIITSDVLPTIEGINDSYGDMKERLNDQLQTDINITVVSRSVNSVNGTNYDYNISVQNTGSVTLTTEDFMILINGTGHPFTCSHKYLHPENTEYFRVVNVTGTGTTRVKVVTNNGIADYYASIS
jgi:archaellum component FlaF (FlaF/FlaG flagellin family)